MHILCINIDCVCLNYCVNQFYINDLYYFFNLVPSLGRCQINKSSRSFKKCLTETTILHDSADINTIRRGSTFKMYVDLFFFLAVIGNI